MVFYSRGKHVLTSCSYLQCPEDLWCLVSSEHFTNFSQSQEQIYTNNK